MSVLGAELEPETTRLAIVGGQYVQIDPIFFSSPFLRMLFKSDPSANLSRIYATSAAAACQTKFLDCVSIPCARMTPNMQTKHRTRPHVGRGLLHPYILPQESGLRDGDHGQVLSVTSHSNHHHTRMNHSAYTTIWRSTLNLNFCDLRGPRCVINDVACVSARGFASRSVGRVVFFCILASYRHTLFS